MGKHSTDATFFSYSINLQDLCEKKIIMYRAARNHTAKLIKTGVLFPPQTVMESLLNRIHDSRDELPKRMMNPLLKAFADRYSLPVIDGNCFPIMIRALTKYSAEKKAKIKEIGIRNRRSIHRTNFENFMKNNFDRSFAQNLSVMNIETMPLDDWMALTITGNCSNLKVLHLQDVANLTEVAYTSFYSYEIVFPDGEKYFGFGKTKSLKYLRLMISDNNSCDERLETYEKGCRMIMANMTNLEQFVTNLGSQYLVERMEELNEGRTLNLRKWDFGFVESKYAENLSKIKDLKQIAPKINSARINLSNPNWFCFTYKKDVVEFLQGLEKITVEQGHSSGDFGDGRDMYHFDDRYEKEKKRKRENGQDGSSVVENEMKKIRLNEDQNNNNVEESGEVNDDSDSDSSGEDDDDSDEENIEEIGNSDPEENDKTCRFSWNYVEERHEDRHDDEKYILDAEEKCLLKCILADNMPNLTVLNLVDINFISIPIIVRRCKNLREFNIKTTNDDIYFKDPMGRHHIDEKMRKSLRCESLEKLNIEIPIFMKIYIKNQIYRPLVQDLEGLLDSPKLKFVRLKGLNPDFTENFTDAIVDLEFSALEEVHLIGLRGISVSKFKPMLENSPELRLVHADPYFLKTDYTKTRGRLMKELYYNRFAEGIRFEWIEEEEDCNCHNMMSDKPN